MPQQTTTSSPSPPPTVWACGDLFSPPPPKDAVLPRDVSLLASLELDVDASSKLSVYSISNGMQVANELYAHPTIVAFFVNALHRLQMADATIPRTPFDVLASRHFNHDHRLGVVCQPTNENQNLLEDEPD
jgi:hypothetical protein